MSRGDARRPRTRGARRGLVKHSERIEASVNMIEERVSEQPWTRLVARPPDEDEWHQLESRQNPSTSDLPASRSHLLRPSSSFVSSWSPAASSCRC